MIAHTVYHFDAYSLDPAERLLQCAGTPLRLSPKIFDLLHILVAHSGRLVSKEEILHEVWAGSFVEEGNINSNISALRKLFGPARYIETVPKRGYRFVAPVTTVTDALPDTAAPPVAPPARQKIAVLPFKTLGFAAADNDYFELGMADALIGRLSNLHRFLVRPTSAVARYAQVESADVVALGRELAVEYVLSGRVQRAGERIRVTVQMISVHDGATRWAGKFDEKWTDIFALQDSLSEQAAQALAARLTGAEKKLLTKPGTPNTAAWQAYQRGRFFLNRMVTNELGKAVGFFQEAIEIDPLYALAYAGLADYYNNAGMYNVLSPAESFVKAKQAASRALELDGQLAEAHTALGMTLMCCDWDWAGAESKFRQAIALNPNCAHSHHFYSFLLNALGRFDEAEREIKLAQQIDPLSLVFNAGLGFIYYNARRYAEAIAACWHLVKMDPNFFISRYGMGMAYNFVGQPLEGVTQAREAVRLAAGSPLALATLAAACGVAGLTEEARTLCSQLRDLKPHCYISPYYFALIYTSLGQHAEAIDELEQSVELRDWWSIWIGVEPRFDPLRRHEKFQAIVRRVGLTQ